MMKRVKTIAFIISIIGMNNLIAQVLPVGEVIQEKNKWCWTGVSKCILDYYGYTTPQCEIAEYTRLTATWHDFGPVDCCDDPDQGCNYWNYNWGFDGSVQDILVHFGGINNYGDTTLTRDEIAREVGEGRPFVIRWGFNSGSGHFLVGHGMDGDLIYYMDPWNGEGLKIALYDWVVDDGYHEWTHTNVITTSPTLVEDAVTVPNHVFRVIPNPAENWVRVEFEDEQPGSYYMEIVTLSGVVIKTYLCHNHLCDIILPQGILPGMYLLRATGNKICTTAKLVVR